MTDRELMQQALEALKEFCEHQTMLRPIEKRDALRERLAQPEQEPVWIQPNHLQKAQQAPFLCRVEPKQRDDFVPLYTTPPQRKPLTDEEIWNLAANCLDSVAGRLQFARAIEAAHGIKGEA